jgi:NAD(P)-dependent dehydrogenase (short-subunit alcohol dehydrogenase family)
MSFVIDCSGRIALVTGSGQGVGLAIAEQLAQAGAEVVVNDLRAERAEAAAAAIVAAGGRARPLAFDVTDHHAVTAAHRAIGGVDILVNNAGNAGSDGFGNLDPFVRTTPAQWEPYLQVNLYGVMHNVHAALPAMIERRWGRVITIVSDAGRTGEANMAAYCAAKAGAAGFMRAIAHESARFGITANNIALGTMRTPVSGDFWDQPDNPMAKEMLKRYLVRRPGDPQDPAGLVVFLASEHAAWITGQTYPVNGGISFAL